MKVRVVENVLKLNDEVASMNRLTLRQAGVFTLDLIGAPGCGKTALLERTLRELHGKLHMAVLVGDLTTTRDADRMVQWCDQVVQINTGKGCHLDANQIRQAMAQIDLAGLDVLIIENVGNLICPVGFDLGQDVKVGMFSVSEGDDKPAKHPYLVHEASVLLLNKTDLLPYVPFNLERFRQDIAQLNPNVPLMELSVVKGDGFDAWRQWIETKAAAARGAAAIHTQ
ncbi:MAG: hydrogenase nickel incorporation protein HypB [Phycisphaeraceae bacterium]|nr:hydrogenase nickel incorporation protein HypB [Phycisphaeraceae bacterium]